MLQRASARRGRWTVMSNVDEIITRAAECAAGEAVERVLQQGIPTPEYLTTVQAATYLALSIPAALLAEWLGAKAGVTRRQMLPAAGFGVAAAAAFVVCLNLLSRWTPAWQAVTPVSLRLLPIGAFDLLALTVGFLALVIGATRVARARPPDVMTGCGWVAAALLVLGGTHAINRIYASRAIQSICGTRPELK